MINWIESNKEWFFSGLGISSISLAAALFKYFIPRSRKKEVTEPDAKAEVGNISQNVTVNTLLHTGTTFQANSMPKQKLLKNQIHILFIDDETFTMVKIIKKAGWDNTSWKKDINNMDDPTLKAAHIIFVDINGVGKALMFQKQGIGLAAAIKDRYPEKKVVIYSGQSNGDRFDKDLYKVDYCIQKNAEPFEFESLINNFMADINGEVHN